MHKVNDREKNRLMNVAIGILSSFIVLGMIVMFVL